MLLDTNVLIAAAEPKHPDHAASLRALAAVPKPVTAVHCLTEFVSTVTRASGYCWPPAATLRQLELFEAALQLVMLNDRQTLDALRPFVSAGRRGPLIYDWLIGQHAIAFGIPTIMTWNARHFVPLFPTLKIVTPAQYLETL